MKTVTKYKTIGKTYKSYRVGGIIVGGVGHSQNNAIGDKGVPVVSMSSYLSSGGKYISHDKHAEIESGEIIVNKETAMKLDHLVNEFDECGCPDKLIALGALMKEALMNTVDQTCRTKCEFDGSLRKMK